MTSPASSVVLTVERLAASGEGVAKLDDHWVGLPGTAPGDVVEAKVERSQRAVFGHVERILRAGDSRCEPACPIAGRCGGCDWQHVTLEAQSSAKQEIVLSALERTAKISPSSLTVRPFFGAPSPGLGQRRRAALHVSQGALHYFEKSSHAPVTIEGCPALVPALDALLPGLRHLLAEADGARVAEVLLLSEGDACSAALVLSGKVTPVHEALARRLRKEGLRGVVLVPVEGEGAPVRVGTPELRAEAALAPGVSLFLRPDAFAQAHAEGNAALVQSAVDALKPSRDSRVLELFGGNGNFTFALAHRAREVWMIEGAPVGLSLARRAADEAKVTNVRFLQGDVAKVVEGLRKGGERFDALLADPPRTGFRGIGGVAKSVGARRVVYVACDVAALARDARELVEAGYAAKSLHILDLFPQTRHVEAVMGFEEVR